jgi:hypothetical protein
MGAGVERHDDAAVETSEYKSGDGRVQRDYCRLCIPM